MFKNRGNIIKVGNRVVLFLMFIVLMGCGKPTIDTSSDEKMKTSIEKVKQSLPSERQKEFEEALQVISFSKIDMSSIFTQGEKAVEGLESKVKKALHGKTGLQVIEEADRIKNEVREEEKQESIKRIKELEEMKLLADKDKLELNKFKIIKSRFYKQKQEYLSDQPIIELKVKNGTEHSISRAYFIGTLKSADREVPWLKESFNYKISGGLKPGEETTWSLSPNMFSEWGTVKVPKDAEFIVEVTRLDGADEKALFTVNNFTDRELNELNELKSKYNM